MNSKERREKRYQRRKEKRESKRKDITFEEVFSYKNLCVSSHKSCLGVGWKPSVQKHKASEITSLAKLYDDLHSDNYKTMPYTEFKINERGKERNIMSMRVRDKIVHKALTENFLIPNLQSALIYDNSACLKYKGVSFARKRLKRHLEEYIQMYGKNGYILLFDFKSYFDSISHEILKYITKSRLKDERLFKLYSTLIDSFGGENGLGLGSQISQISAVYFLNEFDHFIKEELQIHFYGRYMDDGYLLHPSKEYLWQCLDRMKNLIANFGLTFSIKKTVVIKISSGFNYLKRRYLFAGNEGIKCIISGDGMARERRKVKRLYLSLKSRGLNIMPIYDSILAWSAELLKINDIIQVREMILWYIKLIIIDFYKRIYYSL